MRAIATDDGFIMKFRSYLLLSTLTAFVVLAHITPSQAGELKGPFIKGVIVDAKAKRPLAYANVILKNESDGSLAAATVSGETGEFLLSSVPAGRYTLTISFIGYQKKNIGEIAVSSETTQLDLGTVHLEENAVDMGEVQVDAERAPEEFHLDKKVIRVNQSLHARGGNAIDVLREQPSVRVDENDNVTLRGSGNFTVLVNGRPSAFQGSDALRHIPANTIESIELMTNPSAKYEAEGAAGIINIVLKQEERDNTSAIVNVGAGTRDKYNTDGSLSWNSGGTKLTVGADYRSIIYHQVQDVDRNTFIPTGTIVNTTDLRRRDRRKQLNLRAGLEQQFSPEHALSLTLSGGDIGTPRSFTFDVHNVSPSEELYQRIQNNFDLKAQFYSGSLAYMFKPIPGKREITLEGSYTTVDAPYSQYTEEAVTDANFGARDPEPVTSYLKTQLDRYEYRVKLNVMEKFSELSTLEAGLQTDYSSRLYDVESRLLDWESVSWVDDPLLSNRFDLTNFVHAAYATYTNAIAEAQFQLGLRAEYMDRLLTQRTLGQDFSYEKLDWFPSASVSRKFGEHQLQASYSRRISRPYENMLNPFPYYTDRYLSSSGNPRLLPEYTDAVELNYQKMFGTVYVSVQTYLRDASNSSWQSQRADSTGRMIQTFENFGGSTSIGSEISASIRPAAWLRLDPNVNLFHQRIEGMAVGQSFEDDAFRWTARLTATVNASASTRLQVTGMYISRDIDPQSETDPLFYLSVSARQELFDRQLAITLQANNLLRTSYYTIAAAGANFRNSFVIKPEVPMVTLSLSWNFNNFRRQDRQNEGVDVQVGV